GPDHRRLIPGSAVMGAAFLVLCDTAARVVGGAAEFPVGIITACVGGPFFLWLLFRRGAAA
ncbi:iron chelate uptake ABC transporter family permease subunit, partial [Candidatus Poribacteria bacterium]|nr:iron chelate uptake ABC transporter family permease subunit [Candidatus Poribacteria bacterium]